MGRSIINIFRNHNNNIQPIFLIFTFHTILLMNYDRYIIVFIDFIKGFPESYLME